MLQIDNTLVSFDLIEKKFVCDLSRCKGMCCIAGDAGAPLLPDELDQIERALPTIARDLQKACLNVIDSTGVAVFDPDGELVTNTLPGKGACVFTISDTEGNAVCALEKAWAEGRIDFRKPLSCHLYPVRITRYRNYEAVNVHVWDICSAAISKGRENAVPVYVFLKDALIRCYGEKWYEQLDYAAKNCRVIRNDY